MGKTLRRYVLGEILAVLLLGLLLSTFILAVVQLMDLVDLALAKGVPANRVLTVFGYMVPAYMELTLPMALLLSIVMGFARLARDSELVAMRAAGLSLAQLVRPLFGLVTAVAAVSFFLAAYTSPWANRGLEATVTDMAKKRMTAAINAGVFSDWIEDIVVYVATIDARSGEMQQVMLADERDPRHPRTIFALEGKLTTDSIAGLARFDMTDGTILADYESPMSYDKTDFQSYELNLDIGKDTLPADATFMEEPRRMGWPELIATRRVLRSTGTPSLAEEIEIHRRLVVPVACLLLPLIGVPLGAQRTRGVRSRGALLSLVVILLYYFMLTAAVTVAQGQRSDAGVYVLWLPDLALLVVGLLIFRRASKERSLLPARWVART